MIISFIRITFVVFVMLKAYNRATNAQEEEEEEEEEGPSEVDLLTEIRDE